MIQIEVQSFKNTYPLQGAGYVTASEKIEQNDIIENQRNQERYIIVSSREMTPGKFSVSLVLSISKGDSPIDLIPGDLALVIDRMIGEFDTQT